MKIWSITFLFLAVLPGHLCSQALAGMGGWTGGGWLHCMQDAGLYPGLISTPLFSHSRACASCHDGLIDSRGRDVSFFSDWSSTMMANAARDPLWQAKVHSEIIRNPHLKAVIEERCSRCHMPMANAEARITGGRVELIEHGLFSAAHPLHALAIDGISCTSCHQIQPGKLGSREGTSGNFGIDPIAARPYRPLFGVSQNPLAMPMVRRSGFIPLYGSHMDEPELCATCHTLYVPVVDKDGAVVGESPEQTPYLEWRQSAFGNKGGRDYMSCQQCHMPEIEGHAVIARMPRRLLPRNGFGLHHMVGGNAFILTLLRENPIETELTAAPWAIERTLSRIRQRLSNRTATIAIDRLEPKEAVLEIRVRVTNRTGHKFPTAFPSRRAWIHLAVTDRAGQVLFRSGEPHPDGSIAGNEADRDLSSYEPHYDVIESPDQVQIYEAIMMDTDDKVTYTFLRAKEHRKDNRLLPSGFDKDKADPDTRVHGEASMDQNFVGGSDLIAYRVGLGNSEGPYSVKAELLYSSVSHAFLQDLISQADKSSYIDRFKRLFGKADKLPPVISAAEKKLQ
ncbi:MAG: hypothetical protein AB1512_20800 [Thermodesulfobacteriota bacterium]